MSFKPILAPVLSLALVALVGCSMSDGPTASQRQDEILAHPMDYKPQIGGDSSGGSTSSFDRSGFDKDMNDVIDP